MLLGQVNHKGNTLACVASLGRVVFSLSSHHRKIQLPLEPKSASAYSRSATIGSRGYPSPIASIRQLFLVFFIRELLKNVFLDCFVQWDNSLLNFVARHGDQPITSVLTMVLQCPVLVPDCTKVNLAFYVLLPNFVRPPGIFSFSMSSASIR